MRTHDSSRDQVWEMSFYADLNREEEEEEEVRGQLGMTKPMPSLQVALTPSAIKMRENVTTAQTLQEGVT